MKTTLREDHIAIFENALPEKMVDAYLKYYKRCEKEGVVGERNLRSWDVADKAVSTISDPFFDNMLDLPYVNKPFIDHFFKDIYPIYAKKYSILDHFQKHTIFDIKIQKTSPGEGYHTWHCENTNMQYRNRIMAFMVYLNDIKEGGETEFLYQKCRFKPKLNTLLLWPSGFTHTHRGNPPISGDKYIITGWIEYGTPML